MPRLQSLSNVTVFSWRQDITYFCKKHLASKFNLSYEENFTEIQLSSLAIIVDSDFVAGFPDFFAPENKNLLKKTVCLILPCTNSSIVSRIENCFYYTLAFPITNRVLISAIDLIKRNNCPLINYNPFIDYTKVPSTIFDYFKGNSSCMQKIRKQIKNASENDLPLLLLGETGVGKTTAAKCVHNLSKRKDKPFVELNLANIVESLSDSLFFGHTKGTFTDATKDTSGYFSQANGGTLHLDEIGLATLPVQSKLLKVLECGYIQKIGSDSKEKIDVRIISTTNCNMYDMLPSGTFKKDLFFRISPQMIQIPPLREHKEDLDILIKDYFKNQDILVSDLAMEKLLHYNWPGNIRELHHCLFRAKENSLNNIIGPENIDFGLFN